MFFTTLTGVSLLLNSAGVAQISPVKSSVSSRILQEANGTKKMYWGLRTYSPPISFQNEHGGWQGFCTNLIDLLDKYLNEKEYITNDVIIIKRPIDIQKRFIYTEYPYKNKNDLPLAGECGSDSIRKDKPKIKFSDKFFINKTVFIIRKSQKDKFNNTPLNFYKNFKLRIGVIDDTTTVSRLESLFNELIPHEVEIVKLGGREDVINALLNDKKLDAFASDEILIKDYLKELELKKPNEFYIDSQLLISYESYGLILPSDDSKWVNIINQFLSSNKDEIQELIKQHTSDPNPPALKKTPQPTQPTQPTQPIIINISNNNLIILFIILSIPALTCVGYMYWIRRHNFLSETKPNLDPKTPIFAHGYALLIGVGESAYQPWSLPVTVKDVQALRQVLVDPNFCAYPNDTRHVRLLHDKEATRSKILEQLNWLKEQAQDNPEATVVVYYSGHGWFNKSENLYYLVPHDINRLDLKSSSLSAEDFTTALRQIKSERLLVIIDSCHAAGMATAKKAPSDFEEIPIPKSVIDNLKQGKGRVVFTSSQGEESSWIRPDKQMSIYTYHLIEAMKGEANQAHENIVKISHLMKHLSHEVPVSARTLCQEKQTPYFSVESEDFPIALLKGRRPN
ncbi:caspase family protein [Nostoc sp.]